ncbi:ubiquitin carboxyl-terminal hydrolase, family 1 [Xylaria sp. FL1777]|nr:ubiquitin carboxyl-terminal hydrolase, family 1 [Xylaria sp. FL1777]
MMMTPEYKKHFIPLESDPAIFSRLIHLLGAPKSLVFEDVLSLDEPHLLPRPALALIFIFPTTDCAGTPAMVEPSEKENALRASNEDIIWFKQTINNACGLYGILHALSNSSARDLLDPSSFIARLIRDCISLPPRDRASAIEDSYELEVAYSSVARQGGSAVPNNAEDEVDFHYVCFVRSSQNNHLYELDGDRHGPIDTGVILEPEDDLLSKNVVGFVRQYIEQGKRNANYGLMALLQNH